MQYMTHIKQTTIYSHDFSISTLPNYNFNFTEFFTVILVAFLQYEVLTTTTRLFKFRFLLFLQKMENIKEDVHFLGSHTTSNDCYIILD